jgi:hypothetical protein
MKNEISESAMTAADLESRAQLSRLAFSQPETECHRDAAYFAGLSAGAAVEVAGALLAPEIAIPAIALNHLAGFALGAYVGAKWAIEKDHPVILTAAGEGILGGILGALELVASDAGAYMSCGPSPKGTNTFD